MEKWRIPVKPKYLLLTAGIVWLAAGANILRIGVIDFAESWQGRVRYVVGIVAVFAVFMGLIFYRMVQKHHARIMRDPEKRQPILRFFDRKSYLIMFVMITGGITLRYAHLLPPIAIGVLYCGIGASLAGAGLLFFEKFIRACRLPQPNERKEDAAGQ